MFPAPFDYHDPATLGDVLALLAEHAADASLLAGGQSLVAAMNLGIARPAVVIDLQRVDELAGIAEDDGWLVLGAMTRQAEVVRSALVQRACPLLAEAVGLVGNARVRARGTLGGSLAHADPFAELPSVMLVLEAELLAASACGRRTIPARDFFLAPLTTALDPDELLVEVRIPPLPRTGWAIEEVARRPGDFAIAGAAAIVTLDDVGGCSGARLACFGAGPTLQRAPSIEELLTGTSLDDGRIAAATHALDAAGGGESNSDYAARVLKVVVARALARARERATGTNGAGR